MYCSCTHVSDRCLISGLLVSFLFLLCTPLCTVYAMYVQCRKLDLILTESFQIMAILKNSLYFMCIDHAFFQKMAPKSLPPIFTKLSDTYMY